MKMVFMYSGQGSQYYHMGAELYKTNSTFKYWMDKLDTLAKKCCGESIIEILYDPTKTKGNRFDELVHTHPAIFMVEYSLTKVVMEMGIEPDFLLGVSLGEYTVLAISGACSYQEVLELLITESKLVKEQNINGGMIAVMASKNIYFENLSAYGDCELAADNFEDHFVISGVSDDLTKAKQFLKNASVSYQDLSVNHPFHSSHMDRMANDFKKYCESHALGKPRQTIVSCAYNQIAPTLTTDYLWDIVRKPIHFQDTIKQMERHDDLIYIDLGPSGTLSTFVSYILQSKERTFPLMSLFGHTSDNLIKLKKILPTFSKKENLNTTKNTIKMKAYVFPGQGSQKKGMGENLFDEFSTLTSIADRILGYSIKELCLKDPNKQLMQTEYAQVAIYVVNALNYYKKIQEESKPDYVAGHSLGEFNALLAADVFDFETGLQLVKKRGLLMSKATGGGMAAVVGLTEEQILEVLWENDFENIDIANFNSPDQLVISGLKKEILTAQPFFEVAGASLYLPLYVSGAFHSRYMLESSKEFEQYLRNFEFKEPQIPVISNVTARPYSKGDVITKLTHQITNSVKWCESIQYLMGKNIKDYEEIGGNDILLKLIKATELKSSPICEESDMEDCKIGENKTIEVLNNLSDSNRMSSKPPIQKTEEDNSLLNVEKQNKELAESLGSEAYKKAYNTKYAYASGSMYKGISSSKMVIAMAKAGMMSYFGAGGLPLEIIEQEILTIQKALGNQYSYGFNIIHNLYNPKNEENIIDLYLKHGVKNLEASAFMNVSRSLIKFRLKGLRVDNKGKIRSDHRIQAKVSRPEVAKLFLMPAQEKIVQSLLKEGEITSEQAQYAKQVPVATEICVEADSGGHTDRGILGVLLPSIIQIKDKLNEQFKYQDYISIGSAGGIGTPEAAAISFLLGADFIVTGSINQCTVEAGTSDSVKNLLETIDVQDTTYAPAGDMFELGAQVQVVKKGIFFPARANNLFDLYNRHNSYDEISSDIKAKLEKSYFKKSIEEVYKDCKSFYSDSEINRAENNPKSKMAMLFKWYFGYSNRMALDGNEDHLVNYQVHCGSALGAFNQLVKGTSLESWRNRRVNQIGEMLMVNTAEVLVNKLNRVVNNN